MYRPKQNAQQEHREVRPERRRSLEVAGLVLTVVFWVAALIFVGLMVWYALTGIVETAVSLATGISLLVVTVTSGAITWIELRNNPLDDTERGEWTNKMLFYALVFAITFFVAFLYWAGLFFAR